jgi:glycosyltransferase involved in cell wall biosynthesis
VKWTKGLRNMQSKPIRVYVHLAYGLGAAEWQCAFQNGTLLGINEPYPYGYFRAKDDNCMVEYSFDTVEAIWGKLLRLILRGILGFDFIHAWRNSEKALSSDVIWTHTESQTLGILLLLCLKASRQTPKLIGQSVWLFDRWNSYSLAKRWFYSKLLSRADILTVLSPENLNLARKLFPHKRIELVLYAIKADIIIPADRKQFHQPIRLASLGNDRHRDWKTLVDAFSNVAEFEVRIASKTINKKTIANANNITIVNIHTNQQLMGLYEWADVLIITLKPNLHASGITVIQEAVLCGIPGVCSDTGGLYAYFGKDEITYTPHGDPIKLHCAIQALTSNDEERWNKVRRAQRRMGNPGLSSQSYVRRHVELSRELLANLS